MLGYLLARAGVRVTVLEKHKDFLRDFRGDTVHPSTLDVLNVTIPWRLPVWITSELPTIQELSGVGATRSK